ncbi:MAG: hypothetical protein H0W63_04770 [Gemmatimonadaceae bacterium]|nr:hypothetical protein [Gemmatimonadaceae bacterium]
MKRSRLLRYALYQLSDYFWERGVMVAAIALLNLASSVISLHNLSPEERVIVPGNEVANAVLITFGTIMLLAVVFSSQELIGRSRKLGHYKLIFAKPANPALFYGQLFAVNFLGTIILITILAGVFSAVATPVSVWGIAAVTACGFILLGGIGFLVSAFVNFDSLLVMGIVGVSLLVSAYGEAHGGIATTVAKVLPPVRQMHNMSVVMIGLDANITDVIWVLSYGTGAFIAGLVALHFRELAD